MDDALTLDLDGWEGPLDLLLALARSQKVDLRQISILELIEQFLAGMARLERHVALERRADWLVIAARLLLLRSRLLFPADAEAAAEAARDAGQEAERLGRMVFVRAAAAWLDRQPQLGRDGFARPHGRNPRVASYLALMEACLVVLRGPEEQAGVEEALRRPAPPPLFRVNDAMARIRTLMADRPGEEVDFTRCLPVVTADDPRRALLARSAVASSLMAVLELARGGELVATQAEPQGAISVRQCV